MTNVLPTMLFVDGPMGDGVPFIMCTKDFMDGNGKRLRFVHPSRYKVAVNDIDMYRQWQKGHGKLLVLPIMQAIFPNILMVSVIATGLQNGFCLSTRSTWFTGFVCLVWLASTAFLWSRRTIMTKYALWTQALGSDLTTTQADYIYKHAEKNGDMEMLGAIVQRAALSADLRKRFVYGYVGRMSAFTNRNITLEELQFLYENADSEIERGWIEKILEARGGLWAILEED